MVGRRRASCKPLLGPCRGASGTIAALTFKYGIVLCWSRIDGVFVAEVPELPGCMAHGDTQQAALHHVNQAMALWIDTAREFGDPVPEPKGERLMLASANTGRPGRSPGVQNGAEEGSRIASRSLDDQLEKVDFP